MPPTRFRSGQHSYSSTARRIGGFTLIEMLIAVVIIGILASIAIPGYQRYVERSLRADAQAGLNIAAGQLERCYTRSYSYEDCTITESSPDSQYSIDYEPDGKVGFVITAETQRDDGCDENLTLDGQGNREPAECW